jgi:hypothetical protein
VNEERLHATSEFASQLVRHLSRFREESVPLPSALQLSTLIEAVFYASLHEEEARRIEFGVAWQPDVHECSSVIALGAPVLLTPKNLAKLAPATPGESTAIAVRSDGDSIVAWALLERSTAMQQPLTVRALDAGVVRVDYAGWPRALYARGEIVLLGEKRDTASASEVLSRTFDAWRANIDPATGIDLRAAVITRIASQVLVHRHGGMILLMPADVTEPAGVRVHYSVSGGANTLAQRYAQVVRDVAIAERLARLKGSRPRAFDGRISVRDEDQIAFAESIELIAQLTAVDNALLIDTDLNIRGFGVQVIEGDAPKTSFRHTNPYTGESHTDDLSTFKGTRHPAGVIYCIRQPREAAAVVVSQDGHLTLVAKNRAGEVDVIGSYDHAFGWR